MNSENLRARRRFQAALDTLLEQVKEDRHILAAVLCGSLSHDQVYERSDIDLVLVCADDRKMKGLDVALVVDNINIHTVVVPRDSFKKTVEGAARNSGAHSLYAKSKLMFTRDPSIQGMFDRIQRLGGRDTEIQLLTSGCAVAGNLYKARKWLVTREDLELTSLWLLYAATPLAQIEAGLAGEIIGREVITQGQRLNPELFQVVYTGLLNRKKTRRGVGLALDRAEEYLRSKAPLLFKPILVYLQQEGDACSATDINHHFHRSFGIGHVTTACEYLADIGIVDKVSTPVKLTTLSQMEVDELAFFYNGEG